MPEKVKYQVDFVYIKRQRVQNTIVHMFDSRTEYYTRQQIMAVLDLLRDQIAVIELVTEIWETYAQKYIEITLNSKDGPFAPMIHIGRIRDNDGNFYTSIAT